MPRKSPTLDKIYQKEASKQQKLRLKTEAKALKKGKHGKTATAASAGKKVASAVSAATGEVAQTVGAAGWAGVAGAGVATVAPFVTIPISIVDKLAQLRRWYKTRKHLKMLGVIRECAAAEATTFNLATFRAIEYTIEQKEKKKSRSGARGLVPGYGTFIKAAHRIKKTRNRTRGVDRAYHANVLWRNAQLGDPWAKAAVSELVGPARLQLTLGSIKGLDLIKEKLKST